MKMNLRQSYNNIKIRKKDEWKIVFTASKELFEPTVMFFRLTNSLATFQAMISELLRDLINMKKVEYFIDNIMVGTESEKGHDELVEEILKRLEENKLYVKPEICKQKVRKVNFLGVVIGLEGIKIEKAKVKVVLDWLVPKTVKEVQKFLRLANYYRRFVEGFCKNNEAVA